MENRDKKQEQLMTAAEALYNDYIKNQELTVFTLIDKEDFYTFLKIKV